MVAAEAANPSGDGWTSWANVVRPRRTPAGPLAFSVAWAEVISRLDKNPEIHIFFFDVNNGECKNPGDRDSLMYLKIKNKNQKKSLQN